MTELADADAAAARATEQARLRKERREAKIKAGGSARLDRITGLGGGFQRDSSPSAATTSGTDAVASPAPASSEHHADPDEVDISRQHFPSTTRRQQQSQQEYPSETAMSEAQLRQLMLGMDMPRDGSSPNPFPGAANPFLNPGATAAGSGQPGGPEDPMLKMMQQMMGGQMPGGGAFPGMPQPQQQQEQPMDTYSAAWRILHLIVALGLGLYVSLLGTFDGTLESRDAARLLTGTADSSNNNFSYDDDAAGKKARFFYLFATAEAVLLTSRLVLDRTRAPPPGILWTVAGFLPPGLKSYLETALRYGQIFTTVRSDLLACVFVLGAFHWWRTSFGLSA